MWTMLAAALFAAQDPATEQIYRELQKVDRINPVVLVAQAVTPAVVFIQTEVTGLQQDFFGLREYRGVGAGTGVVVRSEGFIVTNYHVVRGARAIRVTFVDDPMPWPAEVVSYIESEDLALLRVVPRSTDGVSTTIAPGGTSRLTATQAPPGFAAARMGTSSDLMPGEQVVAIGNPHGQSHTVSTGIISGLHRDIPISDQGLYFSDLIQTDASINFGNSGGPLLNIRGELIGINTVMNTQAENIGFAIPVDRVVEVLNDHLFPQARTSWLGFELATDGSMEVARVWPEGPAAQAGLCEGDRVLSIGDHALEAPDDWMIATVGIPPGEAVPVRYARGSRRLDATVRPWEKLDGIIFERLGMTLREVTIGSQRWLLVSEVVEGGPAERTGLEPDDLIAAIEPNETRKASSPRTKLRLSQLIQELSRGAPIQIDIYRDEDRDRSYEDEERYTGTIAVR